MFQRVVWGIVLSALSCGLLAAQEKKKILITGMDPKGIAELQASSPGATLVGSTDKELLGQVADADAIIGTISPELVRAGKKLKWVQIGSAGVERYLHLSTPELRDSDITLTNAKIIQGPEIADHALALLLTMTRGTRRFVMEQSKEEWPRGRESLIELRGKTAVIIGVGGIGTQIAVRAKAFGMRIIGVDPKDIPLSPYIDKVVQPNRLDSVLPEADVVFISAPHTPESDQMMGSRQFDLLKKGAYFVAVSRGRLYSMDGLVRALDSRKIAGAGVDVTDPEPLPKGHPLWKFDNVVITPHVAGGSDGLAERRMELYKENIRRFVAGEPMLNVVDKKKGY